EPRGQVSSIEVLHDHVRRAVLERADVAHARDVFVLDADRGLRLATEARDGFRVREHLREEKLDRDFVVELDVLRGDDDAHAPDSEHLADAVFAGENFAFTYRSRHRPRKSPRVRAASTKEAEKQAGLHTKPAAAELASALAGRTLLGSEHFHERSVLREVHRA